MRSSMDTHRDDKYMQAGQKFGVQTRYGIENHNQHHSRNCNLVRPNCHIGKAVVKVFAVVPQRHCIG
ncbi:hypothetical protein HanPSC8_Chr03g0124431 [Helianthus annuus]|nr:hypothetical protein HanPSC8_Chr03g0124431 [Helianthus annuus]